MRLPAIRETDIFVVSFPKSGNTWVRFLIANMLTEKEEITFKNVNDYVPGIYNFTNKINQQLGQRFIKSHDPNFERYPKCIYIYRDYRDVLISYYHFQIAQKQFSGTFSEFIRSKNVLVFGQWRKHVLKALEHQKKFPQRILILGYEQLIMDSLEQVREIESFCEINSKRELDEVVANCSFERLQSIEERYGKVFENDNLKFFRKGTAGQWKNVLSENDLEFVLNENKIVLHRLGYE